MSSRVEAMRLLYKIAAASTTPTAFLSHSLTRRATDKQRWIGQQTKGGAMAGLDCGVAVILESFKYQRRAAVIEALRCIAPSVAPGSFFRDWIRYDGCFALGNAIRWSLTHASCRNQPPMEHFLWDDINQLSNPEEIADRVGFETPVLSEWTVHDRYDDYWKSIDQCLMHPQIKVPGFHAGGWFDHLTRGQFEAYQNIRDNGATELARSEQRLLIGPWGHRNVGNIGPGHCRYGDWDFSTEADLPVLRHEFQFLDFHLKEIDNGYTSQAPVKFFLMGENRWISLQDWPPPEAVEQSWHLKSGGSANMATGDGVLTQECSDGSVTDGYVYDPRDPVPTHGGPIYWGLEHLGAG